MAINIPAQQRLAQPASSFLEGRALKMASQQAEQDLALGEQARELNELQLEQARNPQPDPEEVRAREAHQVKMVQDFLGSGRDLQARAYSMYEQLKDEDEGAARAAAQSIWNRGRRMIADTYGEELAVQLDDDGVWTPEEALSSIQDADSILERISGGDQEGVLVTLASPQGDRKTLRRDSPEVDQLISQGWMQDSVQRIEQGEPGAFTDLPASEATALRDQEVATRNVIGTAADIVNMLNQSPDINTFTASAGRLINNLQQEGMAIANALNRDFDPGILDPSRYAETFDQMGIQNARMRSLFTSLAFQAAAASGQEGRAVSENDTRKFLQQSGASESDPRAIAQVVSDLVDRSKRAFRNSYEVRTRKSFQGDLGEIPEFVSQSVQVPEWYKPPEGFEDLSDSEKRELIELEQRFRNANSR